MGKSNQFSKLDWDQWLIESFLTEKDYERVYLSKPRELETFQPPVAIFNHITRGGFGSSRDYVIKTIQTLIQPQFFIDSHPNSS